MNAPSSQRLVEIDALRGIAALSVVLFHYTTQFKKLYSPGGWTDFEFTHGHLGVNLFFIISGFVIFMTLERTKVPMDFVVSRFNLSSPLLFVLLRVRPFSFPASKIYNI